MTDDELCARIRRSYTGNRLLDLRFLIIDLSEAVKSGDQAREAEARRRMDVGAEAWHQEASRRYSADLARKR